DVAQFRQVGPDDLRRDEEFDRLPPHRDKRVLLAPDPKATRSRNQRNLPWLEGNELEALLRAFAVGGKLCLAGEEWARLPELGSRDRLVRCDMQCRRSFHGQGEINRVRKAQVETTRLCWFDVQVEACRDLAANFELLPAKDCQGNNQERY